MKTKNEVKKYEREVLCRLNKAQAAYCGGGKSTMQFISDSSDMYLLSLVYRWLDLYTRYEKASKLVKWFYIVRIKSVEKYM